MRHYWRWGRYPEWKNNHEPPEDIPDEENTEDNFYEPPPCEDTEEEIIPQPYEND